jgi:hypothetical protein
MLSIDEIIPRCRPHLGEDPDWSKVIYPNPPSHDFCVFLIIAELMRSEHGAKDPLQVSLLFHDGMMGKYDLGGWGILTGKCGVPNLPLSYSNQMVAHVVRPAIDMIGAVAGPDMHCPVDPNDVKHYCEYPYFAAFLVDAARAGYEIPQWKDPAPWAMREVDAFLQGEVPVVITLRETPLQPERNSRTMDWLAFAEEINNDHPVLFVRDTGTANFPLGQWRTFPRASTDVRIRHALYQRAFCNMMVGNGSMAFCMFSPAPYLFFKQLIPAIPQAEWEQGWPFGWKKMQHLDVGDSWPWAGPHQRITWKDDTTRNICEEFEAFVERTNDVGAAGRHCMVRRSRQGEDRDAAPGGMALAVAQAGADKLLP